ncbi:MAG: TolB family protein [Cytophagales bacterium]|nr:TolB family protein [Cytophagales bacterium]
MLKSLPKQLLLVLLTAGAAAQKLPIPAGHTLLITSVRTGDTEVFAVDPVTGTSINLTQAPRSEERYPAWSPDGSRIVFTSDRGDGKTFDLYLAGADGSNVRQLTRLPDGSVAYWPSFTADGKYIYFNEGNSSAIYRVDPEGRQLTRMADGRDGNVSPDGKRIVFTQRGNQGFGVWVMHSDGSNRRQITPHESQIGGIAPVWSWDGKQIAFSGQDGEYAEIFVCNADGGNLRQLTHLQKISSSPAFSRDSQYLTFRVTDEAYWRDAQKREKTYQEKAADKRPVWLMKADGTGVQLVEVLHYHCAVDGSRAEWKPAR